MKASYATITAFKLNEPIAFKDFTLTYKGSSSVNGVRTFIFENFEVQPPQGPSIEVKWSSGTGDIGPSEFIVNGVTYWLELKTSDLVGNKFGKMKDNELIVRPIKTK